MAKKKYTDSLHGAFAQFITAPTAPQAAAVETADNGKAEGDRQPIQRPTASTAADENRRILTPEEIAERKERAKRNAKYINTSPAMYKAATDTDNPRGRRVQLLFRPNIHAELLAIAHGQGRSLNNLIEEILMDYLETRGNE